MADWKPIDSAPKDKPILVYGVCDHWDDTDFYYDEESSDDAKPDVYIVEWVRDEYCDEEYWAIKESDNQVKDPTHWVELPELPKDPITISAPTVTTTATVEVKPTIVTAIKPQG